MKVAYITADFGVPVLGTKGASVHVRQMVSALTAAGHDLLLLTPSPAQGLDERLRCRTAEVPLAGAFPVLYEELKREHIARDNRLSKDIRNLIYSTWMELQAGPILAEFQPEVIYERYSLFGTAGVQMARRLDVPLILEVNAPLVEEQTKQRGLSLPLVARASERMLFRQADHICVVSDWLRDYVVEHGAREERVTVMPNGADPDVFRPADEPSPRRHWLQWKDEFVVGFVGSMKQWHGIPILLEAMKILDAPRTGFRLLLVGTGPEAEALREQASAMGLSECVHLTGAVPHESVPDWIDAMDVAVAPYPKSANDYFSPVKLFEYMSMARAVVAGRVGQSADIIDDGRTGWLYEAGDAEGLAERLAWLATHREAGAAAGAAARAEVLDRYTWEQNGRRVAEIAADLRRKASPPVIETSSDAAIPAATTGEATEKL